MVKELPIVTAIICHYLFLLQGETTSKQVKTSEQQHVRVCSCMFRHDHYRIIQGKMTIVHSPEIRLSPGMIPRNLSPYFPGRHDREVPPESLDFSRFHGPTLPLLADHLHCPLWQSLVGASKVPSCDGISVGIRWAR